MVNKNFIEQYIINLQTQTGTSLHLQFNSAYGHDFTLADAKSVQALSECICKKPNISIFYVDFNFIDFHKHFSKIKSIFTSIQSRKEKSELVLTITQGNLAKLSAEEFDFLYNCLSAMHIQQIDIINNPLDNSISFVNFIVQLICLSSSLTLSDCDIGKCNVKSQQAIYTAIQNSRTLKNLNYRNCSYSETDSEAKAHKKGLFSIILSNKIENLFLSDTFYQFETLDWQQFFITLSKNATLKSLTLWDCNLGEWSPLTSIDDEAYPSIAKEHAECDQIGRAQGLSNPLRKLVEYFIGFLKNTKLQKIEFSHNHFSKEVIQTLITVAALNPHIQKIGAEEIDLSKEEINKLIHDVKSKQKKEPTEPLLIVFPGASANTPVVVQTQAIAPSITDLKLK